MKIKNSLRAILAIGLSLISLFSMNACISNNDIKDGYFTYRKLGKTYAIVGDGDIPYPETLVIPAYYQGKEISDVFYKEQGFMFATRYGPTLKNVQTVYFPYTDDLGDLRGYYTAGGYYHNTPSKIFFSNCGTAVSAFSILNNASSKMEYAEEIYCTKKSYHIIHEYTEQWREEYRQQEINGYLLKNIIEEITRECFIANTSYMFNYDGAPNEGYFFINDFERGGLIENTPYEPLREGYTFGGWYKDSACTEAWDFTVDKLPEAEYDEEGYVTEFVETKLYAKWIEN